MLNLEEFKKKGKKILSKNRKVFIAATPILSAGLIIVSFNLYFTGKIFPNIAVAGIRVSGLNKSQASNAIAKNTSPPEKIELLAGYQLFELSLKDIGFSYDFDKTAQSALNIYRSENILIDQYQRLASLITPKDVGIISTVSEERLNEYIQVVSNQVGKLPTYPYVKLENQEAVVDKGTPGFEVDTNALKRQIEQRLSFRDYLPISLPFKSIDPTLSDEEAEKLKQRARQLIGKSLNLTYEFETIVLDAEVIFSFLDARENYSQSKITDYIDESVAPKVEREPQNAVFKFEEGLVQEFSPAKDGFTVNKTKLAEEIIAKLSELEVGDEKTADISVPVERAEPAITTEEVNNLGISELLGRGESRFAGSIVPRIHNISLAASRFNGSLIPPGETFSFNQTLGDVSSYTGYQQAYVIKDGRTVLGDGGGVCQVSTTFFRAILDAGLPIVERRAHSYRVSYYEQGFPPGLDATVYAPTTDLKFKNDTPGHLLVQTEFKPTTSTLIFEIYGTHDGRIATVTKPVTTSSTPPPEDLYVDDPTLPAGALKQIDYKAWGARVVFDYSVERNGEVLYENTFVSNYRPWQAVYLRGVGP